MISLFYPPRDRLVGNSRFVSDIGTRVALKLETTPMHGAVGFRPCNSGPVVEFLDEFGV